MCKHIKHYITVNNFQINTTTTTIAAVSIHYLLIHGISGLLVKSEENFSFFTGRVSSWYSSALLLRLWHSARLNDVLTPTSDTVWHSVCLSCWAATSSLRCWHFCFNLYDNNTQTAFHISNINHKWVDFTALHIQLYYLYYTIQFILLTEWKCPDHASTKNSYE